MYVICHRDYAGRTFPTRQEAVDTCHANGLGPWRVALNVNK